MPTPKFAIGDWVSLTSSPNAFPTPRLEPGPPVQVDEVREVPRYDGTTYFRLHARLDWNEVEGAEWHFELTAPPAAH